MKKILFSLTIVISCLIFTPNVFAINYLSNDTVNLITYDYEDILNELYRGSDTDLNNFITYNYNNDNFNSYLNKIKLNVATARGYSSFENLSEDYYFIFQFYITSVSSSNPLLETNLILMSKNSSNVNNFDIFLSVTSKTVSSLTNNTELMIDIGPRFWDFGYTYSVHLNDLSTDSGSSSGNPRQITRNCKNGYSSCSAYYASSSHTFNINLYSWLSSGSLFYYYSNYDIDFVFGQHNYFYSSFNYYWFDKLKVNGGNIYEYNDIIASVSGPDIPISNVTNFGDNSYGVNVNYVDNVVASLDSSFTSFDYICPNDRQFVNGVCNIYFSDFTNFDSNFTNFYNQAIFVVGASSNSLVLKSNKYYILSFRLYTSYNLDIDSLVFTLTGGVGNVGVNDIYKIVVNDYTFYKDYQIVFDMPSNINNNIYGFSIKFKDMSTLTNSIDSGYSFGIYKSFKLSEYDTLPTNSVISSNYSNNGIDSISNSNSTSYFSDFKLNDFGLSSVVLMPLNYVRNLPNLVCSSLSLPIPKIGSVNLPCISSFMSSNFGVIWSLYKLIINGLICYKIIINLFATIKNIYKPDNDSIEVIDL